MNEHVCKFGADRSLLGISSDPAPAQRDTNLPTIILLNAGLLHHVGQNRLNVILARHLADMGYATFRFDFSGLGDSAVQDSTTAVRERNVAEIQDAMDFLEETRGVKSFVLIGLCTGADSAHRAAVVDDRVRGIAMIDGYSYLTFKYVFNRVHDKIFSPLRWKNFLTNQFAKMLGRHDERGKESTDARSFFWVLPKKSKVIRELRELVRREVLQLQVFSGSNIGYNYPGQYAESLRAVDFRKLLRVRYVERADHTYSMLEDRLRLVIEIASWLDSGFNIERVVRESAHLMGANPHLSGILSLPDPVGRATRNTGIVILSSGLLHRVGPFRLHVGLARHISMAGYAVLRLDQAGRGDSSRSQEMSQAETIQREFDIAAEFLSKTRGIDNIVLIGLCSGADDALELVGKNDKIVGLVLLDGYAKRTFRSYVHYYLPRLLKIKKVSRAIKDRLLNIGRSDNHPLETDDDPGGQLVEIRNFVDDKVAADGFTSLMQRGGSFLGVFTGDVEGYYSYEGQLGDCWEVKDYGRSFKEVYLRRAKHTYPVHAHRHLLTRVVAEWCSDRIA